MAVAVVVSSRIERVQVFRRGAVVTREAVVDVASLAGADRIELAGLPLSLLDASARVRIVAVEPTTAAVTATGLQVGMYVKPGLPPPKAPEQQAIDDVARRIEELEELARLIDNEVELLTSIPVPDRPAAEEGRAPPPAPLAMRLALETFVDDAAEARRLERRGLEAQIKALRRELEALIERAHAASTAAAVQQDELSKSVIVPLALRGPVERFTVELRYFIPGARWAPAYHVKLARDGSSAVIHQRAHIAQRSGEDWTGVKLSLSTAMPLRYSELPELASIRIGKAQPAPPKRGFRPPPRGAAQLFADLDRDRQRVLDAVPSPRAWRRPALEPDPTGASTGAVAAPSAPTSARKKAARSDRDDLSSITMSIDRGALLREAASMADVGVDLDDPDLDFADDNLMAAPPPAGLAMRAAAPPSAASRSMRAPSPAPAATRPRGPGAGVDDVVDAIVFPLLRLPGPDDIGGRGRLMPVDVRRLYAESAARCGRPVPFDLAQLAERAEYDAMQAGGDLPAGCIDLGELTSNYDFSWTADGVIDVVADGAWHSVPLGDRQCAARVRYITVPREELLVYRVAVLQNPLASPLLSGPAEVYVGGEYVLTTTLPMVAARGELTLGLGVEQAIKVARNARFKEVREGEGVVAMVELVHDVDVELVNHLGRAVEIEVRERVPVAAPNAEVQVSERDVTPAWEVWDQQERGEVIKGGRRWQITVEAGATSTLKARYVLRLFSNAEIQGGNRREA
jgi:hypothetical protein